MKKIIIGILLCTAPIFGQQQNTITVIGETFKKTTIKEYVVNIEIKDIVADTYQNIESKKRPQLIEEYKSKLNSIGIDFKKFKENKLYAVTGLTHRTNSNYYYTTTSFEEVEKMFGQLIKGVTIIWIDIIPNESTNTEIATLNSMAIQDAANKATLTAKNINKKIGDIQKVETLDNRQSKYYNTAKPKEPQKYYVQVTFLLE
ncbi:hypothetical protein [Aquimarina sp. AU474]|uniref:hypothetical protein n=1 Tax=Aquimarina sp. AU474 TaxID=2108529 RepID=UPI000D68C68F|nr:hypothetical protein [Aquimarina sp. AU474]